jgi:hypothetical protein
MVSFGQPVRVREITYLEEFPVRFEHFTEDVANPGDNSLLTESGYELVKERPVLIEGLPGRQQKGLNPSIFVTLPCRKHRKCPGRSLPWTQTRQEPSAAFSNNRR